MNANVCVKRNAFIAMYKCTPNLYVSRTLFDVINFFVAYRTMVYVSIIRLHIKQIIPVIVLYTPRRVSLVATLLLCGLYVSLVFFPAIIGNNKNYNIHVHKKYEINGETRAAAQPRLAPKDISITYVCVRVCRCAIQTFR